MNNVF
jgi:hypothetical protein